MRQEYKCKFLKTGFLVSFKCSGRNVKIFMSFEWRDDFDVCLYSLPINFLISFGDPKHAILSKWKKQYPTAPIILVGDVDPKRNIEAVKKAELTGIKMINSKSGIQFARKIGATKYIEYSRKSGRGLKIVFDEIAYTYLVEMKDNKERRERALEEEDRRRREDFRKQSKEFCRLLVFVYKLIKLYEDCAD